MKQIYTSILILFFQINFSAYGMFGNKYIYKVKHWPCKSTLYEVKNNPYKATLECSCHYSIQKKYSFVFSAFKDITKDIEILNKTNPEVIEIKKLMIKRWENDRKGLPSKFRKKALKTYVDLEIEITG